MSDIELTKKVVINRCAGGYGLSREASYRLAERKGLVLREEDGFLYAGDGYDRISEVVPRDDADLIEIVTGMGEAANGPSANLKVVDVRIHVEVECRAGYEGIHVWGQSAGT